MELILTSTIEYIENVPEIWERISQVEKLTFMPLAMPQEMDNDAEWQTFYGEMGQLRYLYEAPFQSTVSMWTWLNIFTMAESKMCEIVEQSDCIILVGGDPKALVERLRMMPSLYQTLTCANQFIIGVSAGAKIWFTEMFVEHEDQNGQIHLEITDGIGYFETKQAVAAHIDFSYEQMQRLHVLLRETAIEEIIAIGNNGAITYNTVDDQLELYGEVKLFQ